MREEAARLRDELRAEEDRTLSWRIVSAAAELSSSRACRERDEAKGRVLELEKALSTISCAAETVLLGDLSELTEIKNVLAGVALEAGVALGFYDPASEERE